MWSGTAYASGGGGGAGMAYGSWLLSLMTSEPQIVAEPLGLGSAHRDLGAFAVPHPQKDIAAEPGHDFLDFVDVHEVRPVHAPEDRRVQVRLQFIQCPIVGRS